FSLVHLTPGDPVEALFAGENISAEQKEAYRRQIGLDRPLLQQYLSFVAGAVQGDLGTSIRRNVPVSSLISDALPATLELTFAALVIAILLAVPVAFVSALQPGSLGAPAAASPHCSAFRIRRSGLAGCSPCTF